MNQEQEKCIVCCQIETNCKGAHSFIPSSQKFQDWEEGVDKRIMKPSERIKEMAKSIEKLWPNDVRPLIYSILAYLDEQYEAEKPTDREEK